MNIKDFKSYVNEKILKRGFQYYKDGNIESLDFENNEWIAYVSGSDNYEVKVKLSNSGDILSSDCDCPYEFGEHCKHEVAVFYALAEKSGNLDFVKKVNKSVNIQPNLEDILKKQDKAILISILVEYAKQDKQIKEDLLLRFSTNIDEFIKQARNLVKVSIKKVTQHGYVEYADTKRAIEGANKVLKIAESMPTDYLLCITLYTMVFEEMLELENYCDDSNGYVGGVIEEALQSIGDITNNMPEHHSEYENVFNLIYSYISRNGSSLSYWQIDLIEACIPMCGLIHLRKKLVDYLLSLQNFSHKYIAQKVQNTLYSIINRFEGQEEAYTYIEQNIENSDFRKIAIQRAIDENQFNYALSLCLDGEQSDSEYMGLVSQWKEMRYSIYEKVNNIEEQKKLAMEFVMNGKFEYFLKLKELYTMDEWKQILETLIESLNKNRNNGIYIKILIHENLKERILSYCQANPFYIVDLYSHLIPKYEDEVDGLFINYIIKSSEQTASRNHYKDVCKIIKHYKNACGIEKATIIVNELLKKYPRRPAFVDELNKLNFIKA